MGLVVLRLLLAYNSGRRDVPGYFTDRYVQTDTKPRGDAENKEKGE